MKILAIDYGLKRIGFAIGNPIIRTATPIDPIIRKNSKQAVDDIKQLVDEYDITKIIVGHPLNMDGSKSNITLQVENFAKKLKNKLNIDTQLVDERLTSFEADEVLKNHQPDYKKRKKKLDSISASIILNSYMESL
ncbi:MAG: Holliday junction resolvase RuvX [bacterium]|nr:Holliday junction resolvase RuvX [bacterium]